MWPPCALLSQTTNVRHRPLQELNVHIYQDSDEFSPWLPPAMHPLSLLENCFKSQWGGIPRQISDGHN